MSRDLKCQESSVIKNAVVGNLPYHLRVDVRKREDMNVVENFIRYLQKTSAISNRCPILETSNYIHARVKILQWIALKDKLQWTGENASVYHLGDSISMHVFYESGRSCVNVEVDGHLPGAREGLPVMASTDIECMKKPTKQRRQKRKLDSLEEENSVLQENVIQENVEEDACEHFNGH